MARTSDPHSATAQFFINVADNAFLDHKGPSPQGWGYCVFGKVTAGQDVVDKIKGVKPRPTAECTRTSRRRTSSSSAPRKSHKADAVRFRPPPVAGATGAGGGVRIVLRRVGAHAAARPVRARRSLRSMDRRRPACASRWRRASQSALRGVAAAGVPVGIIVGNRDFLLGPRFAEAAGAMLLPERVVVDVAGTPTLLMHGDEMCTSDVAYQRFRAFTHDPRRQPYFLALPYAAAARHRRRGLRRKSRAATAVKPEAILDVEPAAVDAAFRDGERRADHPWPHAPSGAAPSRRRRPRLRAMGARRLVRSRQLPRIRRRGRTDARALDGRLACAVQRLREIGDQVVAILDADRDANEAVGDAHFRAALGAHLPEDRVRDRYRERAVVAQVRRRHDDVEAVEEIEAVDAVRELEREEPAEAARRASARARAARATGGPGSTRVRIAGARRETPRAPARSRTCAPCAARASRRRPRWDAHRRPRVPPRSRAVPSCGSAESPRARAAATCSSRRCSGSAVQSKRPVSVMLPASALPCPPMYLVSALTTSPASHRLGPEQRGRGHRVVDDVENSALLGERADPREIRDLRARVGDRLDEDEPRRRRQRALDVGDVGRVDERDVRLRAPRSVLNRLTVLPNRNRLTTTWSPSRSSDEHHRADRRHARSRSRPSRRRLPSSSPWPRARSWSDCPAARTRSPCARPWNTAARSRASR